MKKILSIGLILLLLVALAAPSLADEVTLSAETLDEIDNNYDGAPIISECQITVEATATVKVKPDVAYITLGVQTTAEEAKGAQAENAKLMNAVIDAIKATGIADKDIKTEGFYINPNINYETQETTGYQAVNNVTVTLRDIALVSTVIDAAIDAGANNANSVSFNVSDPDPYYHEAMTKAVSSAKAKATVIADALGVSITLPMKVTEKEEYWYSPMMGNYNSMSADASAESSPIQSGEIAITARIELVYGYK